MINSAIEWTDSTWNPVRGCTRISEGCRNCYAERMASRFCGEGKPFEGLAWRTRTGPRWTGKILQAENHLIDPLHWRRPRRIFVNSMSDLFHKEVELDYIRRVFDVMNAASWHQYQILTKRSDRLLELSSELPWAPHIWMGVSVENADVAHRIDELRRTAAHVKFLSIEPLIGPLHQLDLEGIDWVIVGGESGPGARPMEPEWVLEIRDQCCHQGVPFFFKQWGGVFKKATGRLLDGRTWDEMPAASSLWLRGVATG